MALPQTIDPTTLNISGKPAIATAPTTTTSAGATGMPSPTIAQEKSNVSPLLGALFGGALGMKYASSQGAGGTGGTGANQAGAGGANQNILGDLIKAVTGKGTSSGLIGSVNNVIVPPGMSGTEAQNWLNTNYGMTNGQPNYVVSGTNLSTGEAIGLPNTNIGGANLGTNTGNYGTTGGGTTGSTDTLTNIGSGYFMDDDSNVYDSNGNLIYRNPSNVTGTQTEPSGGGYDPNTTDTSNEYFQTDAGDIYDGLGNLVLAFNNGYYYEPDTGNFYNADTFEPVDIDFNAYTDYFNIPTLDTSGYGDLGDYFDYGDYTSGSTTIVKDGGSIHKKQGGLATPLFARGGYADGDLVTAPTSFTDQVVANQVPTATSTTPLATSNATQDTSSTGSILNSILNFAQSNPALTGAGLGALLTQLINSSSSYPVNKGVDMTALGTLKPRTTPTGASRFVPYSEYGTPTTPFDYSTLYSNLGVSPFGGGAVSPSSPTSAAPTPTTPTGALSTIAPSMPVTTTPTTTAPTTTAPTYFTDADGNIYDADGNLVFDTTSGASSPVTGDALPSATTAPAMSGLAVPNTTLDATYSYGTPVSPSEVLGVKKGGLTTKKMADGGIADLAVTSLSDAVEAPVFDYSDRLFSPMGGVKYDETTGIVTDSKGYTMDVADFVGTYGSHPSTYTPDFYDTTSSYAPTAMETTSAPPSYAGMSYDDLIASGVHPMNAAAMTGRPMPTPTLTDKELIYGTGSTEGNYYDGLYHPNYTGISTGLPPTETDLPTKYIGGMPEQRETLMPTQGGLMPTQGPAMPTQGPAMPTQGALMPSQTSFSSSPTFRYSGANNPLLVGLRQAMPNQQPFMLMPNGTFAPREEISTSRQYGYAMGGQPITDNLNVPVSNRPFQNVPEIQGRGDYRQGSYVEGAGDGQSDDIPAMLADGEYVIDAETVAQLGNGSNKAGAKVLDQFRKNIRAHKRSAPHDKIPPKSKSPLAYLKGAK